MATTQAVSSLKAKAKAKKKPMPKKNTYGGGKL